MSIPASYLPVMLRGIARRADTTAANKAADKMAPTFLRGVKDVELVMFDNPPGDGWAHGVPGARADSPRSPSPVGEPPAHVTGHLRDSGHWRHYARGEAIAYFTAVYAAFQEFGGTRGGKARWLDAAGWHNMDGRTDTPERPYMRRATERMTRDGSLRDAAIKGFLEADIFAGWDA